ncbi:TetR/AcrR family transcriptional regulator [Rubrivirga sp. S365]|uniref:TetR/AcrR family transcriptional regulator n=1 Tax=Rubrivirga litoralis TaxID=3075598 RepID=A0ABU3BND5_9BACT|nr:MULTISPECIES: TetR/AcrR family transcriptional regulator [unclassified Rubrivirga]MDT0630806.1 TetR/AcrR family transcriptional regulator [Rubrivirga sp. F394]MDT7857357.1 TetR/AcrR family transcriptional regulator [Rubrivirga sp. S365]
MTSEKPLPTWKERAQEMLRAAILDAARATFAERGYLGATVDEIAARAEVGKGTIYNHVEGGKAGLFVAVLGQHFDELHALADRHLAEDGTPLRGRFHAFATRVAAYFEAHRDLLRVHLREVPQLLAAGGEGEQAEALRARRDGLVEALVPPIERAVARGELRPVPARLTAHVAFGALIGTLIQTVDACAAPPRSGGPDAGGPGAGGVADYLTALLFDGVAAGPVE